MCKNKCTRYNAIETESETQTENQEKEKLNHVSLESAITSLDETNKEKLIRIDQNFYFIEKNCKFEP